MASILLLVMVVVLLVNNTPVQNYLARREAAALSKQLKTKVTIEHIRVDFLNHLLIQGLYIEDQQHDTLLYAGEVQVRINDWFVFKDKPVLHYIAVKNTYAHLYRPLQSKVWNFEFITDAFASKEKDTVTVTKPFDFDLKKLGLESVRFYLDDGWGGMDLDFVVGHFDLDAKDINFTKKQVDITDIVATNTDVILRDYKGGHALLREKTDTTETVDTPDFTPFNPDKWGISLSTLSLAGCAFHMTMDTLKEVPGLFDQNHLAITNVQLAATALGIIGDTIHGTVESLSAKERCGIAIKQMRSKVTVSPNASVCANLYLETNYSKIQDYYAMEYKHFPDFLNYIDSVTMVGHLKNSLVDERDIAYFTTNLKDFPQMALTVTGEGKGTVANLAGHAIITDGISTLKGNVTMAGLPDIYKTWITVTNADLITNSRGLFRYVPALRKDTDIALGSFTSAHFRGRYDGYIDSFSIKGTFNSNLGAVTANINMDIPDFNSKAAVYSGSVATDSFQMGRLIKQPLLGKVTMKEDISGSSFDPDQAQLIMDGHISEIGINGYDYHDITTHDTLAKRQFNGSLLVNDPNLALEFAGGIDYSSKEVAVNAKAHLLWCNFQALGLSADTLTAAADFDLDCTGSNIDNFFGYAKLNNIDMKRNRHKVALDSVLVNAVGDTVHKLLTITSNALTATIRGEYQLSKLPYSVQYYLSRYLPNYIQTPVKDAPPQNLSFDINTTSIDSLLAVATPLVRGFDSASFSGSLNTAAQKLELAAKVPYGSIGRFRMSNISINGIGNLDKISVNTNIENVAVGDVNGSLSVTSIIGSDSVSFTVGTTTPDNGTTITLNGKILARRDSLFLTMLPSQFSLNQAKWDIAGGSSVVYSDKSLMVSGLVLSSGLQKISAATVLQNNDRSLVVNTENLDLGQLGIWAGLAAYQPDGRLNGTIKIEKIFKDLIVTANMRATGVLLGTDTIGTVNMIGSYDGAKQLLVFDPQSGIYRGSASMSASGNISFDSATHQKLDGHIQFSNAPVSWATPFLAGLMSHLSGTLDGTLTFAGAAYEPELDGTVTLQKAGLRLDYMGCNYTIPDAIIHVDNRSISFGTVDIFDSYKNRATLTGYFSHNLFRDMSMRLTLRSTKFEVMNLSPTDNSLYYGNLIAGVDSFTVRGPFNDFYLRAHNAYPAAKSRVYIPVSSGGELSAYNYVTFKTYGKTPETVVPKSKDKMHIKIDASLNPYAEMHIVLDPSSGDEIMARGEGNIELDLPPDADMRVNGTYTIDNGTYNFTFKQLLIHRQFMLNSGSTISFNGPFSETSLDVDAIFSTKARLADLLTDAEKQYLGSELTDAQTPQLVDVKLNMKGLLKSPKLTFNLDLEDKHSQSTLAYRRLMLINTDDRQKLDQVASLLLIESFIPPDGIGTGTVATAALNNMSQLLSSSASNGLTKVVNKITGDKAVNVDVKYANYNYSDQSSLGGINRNQFKIGLVHNYLNDRLIVEVGSTSDWGKPTSTSASSSSTNFNITGDFRVQYLLRQPTGLRINCFRTSDYDVTLDRDIIRSGVGVAWRKSFDNLDEFFHSSSYAEKQKKKLEEKIKEAEKDTTGKKGK